VLYPSGAGFTLSIDLVKRIIHDPPAFDQADDITVGRALEAWGIPITQVRRINFTDDHTLESAIKQMPHVGDAFQFRIKTAPEGRQERDLEIHRILYERFYRI
jgi:hypothetical protein